MLRVISPVQSVPKDRQTRLSAEDWVKKKEYEPNNFGEIFNDECRKLREQDVKR